MDLRSTHLGLNRYSAACLEVEELLKSRSLVDQKSELQAMGSLSGRQGIAAVNTASVS